MLYQVITSGRLCQSKKYFTKKKDIKSHIKEVIKKTDDYYKKNKIHVFCDDDIWLGVRITKIDEEQLPEWKDLFGNEQDEITHPFNPLIVR